MMRQNQLKSCISLRFSARQALALGSFASVYIATNPPHILGHHPEDLLLAAPLVEVDFRPKDTQPYPRDAIAGGTRFRPSRENPYPEETESSGVRNDALCAQDQQSSPPEDPSSATQALKALAPNDALKLTASGRPTFWIALPQTQAKQIILSIEKINPDNNSKTFHAQKRYPVSQSPALMGLTMPEDAPDLEADTAYQWSVILMCGETPHPSDPFIFSTIQRKPRNSPLSADTPTQDSAALSQAGFWYDPVSILLTAHLENPQDQTLIEDWRSLLESAGLETIGQNYGPTKSPIYIP